MMESINNELIELKALIKEKKRLERTMEKAKNHMRDLERKKTELHNQLVKEELDVEKLEGLSVKNIFHTIIGDKVEKLDKEKKEAVSAKLKYDWASEEFKKVTMEINELEEKIQGLGNLDQKYNELIKKKENMLLNQSNEIKNRLDNIVEKKSQLISRRKELKEAIQAGNNLMRGLEGVKENLTSAGNWGMWDMLGGGLLSTAMKHSKIDEAKHEINRVQSLLNIFHRELKDVGEVIDVRNIEIGSFLTFADYFFDGLFVDWSVQSKINEAKDRVYETIHKVRGIMGKLNRELHEVDTKEEEIEKERLQIIEEVQ